MHCFMSALLGWRWLDHVNDLLLWFLPLWSTQSKVCGLCGNNNGDLKDDFTTRHSLVTTTALEFGNSWKTSQECSDTVTQSFPCDSNPYCKAWAEKKCEIIRDDTFRDCHSKVALFWVPLLAWVLPRHSCVVFCLGGPHGILQCMYRRSLCMWHGGEVPWLLYCCGNVCRGMQCSWSLCLVEKAKPLS